jgi:Family of unknown function (DUF5683)
MCELHLENYDLEITICDKINRNSYLVIRTYVFLFTFLLFPFIAQAGNFPADTIAKTDTAKVKIHSPKKAALLSACLPGLGQVYNHKAWKVPIIYAGFGGLGFGFGFNQKNYSLYRSALRLRHDDDPSTIDDFPEYSDDDLVTLKNYYQRYRDLCIIGAAALYTLTILDAAVDAHLYNFDVSDNLALQFKPSLYPTRMGMISTIQINLHYR